MAKLDSLVRVRKHNVEQQQKALAVLYQRSEALKAERDSLETQLAIESEKSLGLYLRNTGHDYVEPDIRLV